jgi:hypothetical protein
MNDKLDTGGLYRVPTAARLQGDDSVRSPVNISLTA